MKLGAIKEPRILGERVRGGGGGNKSEICQRFIPAVRILALVERRPDDARGGGNRERPGKRDGDSEKDRERRGTERILHWEKMSAVYTAYTRCTHGAQCGSMHANNSAVACAT